MSDEPKDGGPAFPVIEEITPSYYDDHARQNGDPPSFYTTNTSDGMSVRDYFAAKAMAAITHAALSSTATAAALAQQGDVAGRTYTNQLAYEAYVMADAMLAARKDQR